MASTNTATSEAPVAGSFYTHWPAGAASSSDLKRATHTQLAALVLATNNAQTSVGAITAAPTALASWSNNYGTMAADGEITLPGSPVEGERVTLKLTVSGATRTLTHPTVNRIGTNTTPTTTDLAVGHHKIVWEYANSLWWQTDVGE